MIIPSKRPAASAGDLLTIVALLFLAGCLPSSCQRMESTTLLPADSLSRETSASAPVDTLRLAWTISGTEHHALAYPRTVRFGGGDTIFVADVERNSIFVVAGGRIASEVDLGGVEVPYLAGLAGDTISIFSPASLSFYRLHDLRLVDSTKIDDPGRQPTSLVYGAAGETLHYKRVDPDRGGFVASFTRQGAAIDTTELEGPHWRYAGLLKMWGDTLISLSGFRPVIDMVAPQQEQGEMVSDTLALVGFDSPMLARSRSFMLGEVHEAPLLSSSAAPSGELLFVLNMRAGWLQVDVFGRDGVLRTHLVPPGREYQRAFFPQDLDVRRTGGGFEIAVAYSQPEPSLSLYVWEEPTGPSSTSANGTSAFD